MGRVEGKVAFVTALVFLTSDEAPYVTGVPMPVDAVAVIKSR
jgi:hypothetical protein